MRRGGPKEDIQSTFDKCQPTIRYQDHPAPRGDNNVRSVWTPFGPFSSFSALSNTAH